MPIYHFGWPARVNDDNEYVPTYFNIAYHWPDAMSVDFVRARRRDAQQQHDRLRNEQKVQAADDARETGKEAKACLRVKKACDIVLGWLETGKPPLREWPVELAAEFDDVLGASETAPTMPNKEG